MPAVPAGGTVCNRDPSPRVGCTDADAATSVRPYTARFGARPAPWAHSAVLIRVL